MSDWDTSEWDEDDFRESHLDYFIRCKECKNSTYQMIARERKRNTPRIADIVCTQCLNIVTIKGKLVKK